MDQNDKMNFKKWLYSERTLYHGTVIDNLDSIKRVGLVGADPEDQSSFVYQAYSGMFDNKKQYKSYMRDRSIPVFLSDKESLNKSLSAMKFHIGKKLKKDLYSVTDMDIRNHGLLVIVKDTENYIDKAADDSYRTDDDYRFGVEPDDYYSDDGVSGDIFLYGSKLVNYLNQRGLEIVPDEKYAKKISGKKNAVDLVKYPLFRKQIVGENMATLHVGKEPALHRTQTLSLSDKLKIKNKKIKKLFGKY